MPKTFNPSTDIPSLTGKVILVTGGNAGLGAATVAALAGHSPSAIYLTSRDATRGEAAASSVRAQHPDAKIHVLPLDLNSLESVKACAAEFTRQSDQLDLLILNAGIAGTSPQLTQEGYEHHFGVNHVGHALLTQLLLPTLLRSSRQQNSDTRIVVVSSVAANSFAPKAGLVLADVKKPCENVNFMQRYGHSKLANVLFARKLAQRYPGITTTAVHPGTVQSEIWSKTSGVPGWMNLLLKPFVAMTGVTNEVGAKTQLWCATAAKGGNGGVESGKFYQPIGVEYTSGKFLDQTLVDELWEWTNTELASHGATGWPEA